MGFFAVAQRGWRWGAAAVARVLAVVCVVAVVGGAPRAARAELLWSAPATVDPPPAAAEAAEWSPALSCASAAWCMLVDGAGRAAVYDGSGWSAPAAIDPGQKLSAVSCASPTFCVAVDGAGHALTFDGSVWSAPLAVDPDGSLTSVSCPTTALCLAVDDLGNAVTLSGSAWSAPTSVTTPGGSSHLGPVSCTTAGFCAVAYSYPDGECLEPGPAGVSDDGSPGADGMLVSDAGQWGQPQLLTQVQCQYHEGVEPPFVTGLSCASASFCVALDSSAAEWNYDGTDWRPMAAGAGVFAAEVVACPSASQCEGFDDNSLEAEDDGSGFSDPQLIWVNGAAVSVSCASTEFCAAVDSAGEVVFGTAVGPLVTLTVAIDQAADERDGYVTFTGPMPACHASGDVPCARALVPDTAVTLTASDPSKSDRLLGWTGGGCSGTGTCTPTVQSDTTVTAVFASGATSDLARVADPGRDTLRSLRAGGTPRRADLPLPGTLTIIWTAHRRVLASARVTTAAPGDQTPRLRLTQHGRSQLTHAPHTLIGWRAVFSASDGQSATSTGSDYLH
jgi:hypothetical protein